MGSGDYLLFSKFTGMARRCTKISLTEEPSYSR